MTELIVNCRVKRLQIGPISIPSWHIKLFQRPSNVYNVKITLDGCWNNMVCQLGRSQNLNRAKFCGFWSIRWRIMLKLVQMMVKEQFLHHICPLGLESLTKKGSLYFETSYSKKIFYPLKIESERIKCIFFHRSVLLFCA